MITLSEVLKGYNPKAGRPVPLVNLYAANLISKGEWERVRLEQQREDYRARKRAREELRMDIAAMVRGEEPRRQDAPSEDERRERRQFAKELRDRAQLAKEQRERFGRCADGVPTQASQLAARANVPPQDMTGIRADGRDGFAENI